MKRTMLFIGFVLGVLIALAALDDITTGSEESYFGEYLFLVVFSATVLVLRLKTVVMKFLKRN